MIRFLRRGRRYGQYPIFTGLADEIEAYQKAIERYSVEREVLAAASSLERWRWPLVFHCLWNISHPTLNAWLFGPSSVPSVGFWMILAATVLGGLAGVGFYRWRTRLRMADLEWLATAS